MKASSKLPALDGLRGLAALSVVVWHVVANTAPEWTGLRHQPALLRFTLADLGRHGVSLFFVLSGFLLSLPFLRAALDGGPAVDLRRYARARILRIYPAWLVAVVLVVPFQALWLLRDPLRLPLFAGLQQYAYDAASVHKVLPQSWTLTIEVWFYLLLPLGMLATTPLLRRLPGPCRLPALGGALVLVIAACLAYKRYGFTPTRAPRTDLRPFNFLVLSFADHFACGMLAAAAYLGLRRRPRPSVLYAAAGAIYVADVCLLRESSDVLSRTILAGAFALVVLAAALAPCSLLAARAPRALGRLSYGAYLWHYPVVLALRDLHVMHPHHPWTTAPMLALVLAMTLLLAEASWRLVEAPALALVDRPAGRPPWRSRLARSPNTLRRCTSPCSTE